MNTILQAKTENAAGEETTEDKKEKAESCPVMTAFYRGRKTVPGNVRPSEFYRVYANASAVNLNGDAYPEGFDLVFGTSNGLYYKFWKEYAAVIRHSFNQLNLPLRLNIRDILSFRFDKVYIYQGQPLLPETLEFEIDKNDNVKVINAFFKTIRLYEDVPIS